MSIKRGIPLFSIFFLSTQFGSITFAQVGTIDAEFAGGGARALAMGGSFIALADDATAVEFNPAGLWQLRTPEIAAQMIYTYDRRRQGSVVIGSSGLEIKHSTELNLYVNPSFLSFVYPMQNLTIGLSEFTNVYFKRGYTDPIHPISSASRGRIHESCSNHAYGLTFARNLAETVTAGLTLRYNMFRYESDTSLGDDFEFESGAPSANVGVIWRINPKFRAGAVYKSQQSLKGDYGGVSIDTRLPDTLGCGLAYLPNKRWRAVLDIDHIWWSKFEPNPHDAFVKDDVWRYHTGLEWYAGRFRGTGIFLRGGYFYEQPNAYRYTASPGDPRYNPILKELSSERDAVNHYTFGFGLARSQCQWDFGVAYADDTTVDFITSVVVYF